MNKKRVIKILLGFLMYVLILILNDAVVLRELSGTPFTWFPLVNAYDLYHYSLILLLLLIPILVIIDEITTN